MGKGAVKAKLTRSNSGIRKTRKMLVPTSLRRQEERTLVKSFKIKKKRMLLKKMVKEDPIKDGSCTLLDDIKIEVKDVLKDKELTSAYSISPAELKIICPIEAERTAMEEEEKEIRVYKSSRNGMKLLFLFQNQEVAMRGVGSVQCLCGAIEINGYQINENFSEKHSIYSPDSSNLLCIRDTSTGSCTEKHEQVVLTKLKTILDFEDTGIWKFVDQIKQQIFSCVVIDRISETLPVIVRTLNSYEEFGTKGIKLLNKSKQSVLKTSSWRELYDKSPLLKEPDCHCTIMICGGKDVGKSTFARYTINRLLNKHSAVYYLECDCGQTEFTPPGVLSLVKVTKPLLGPSFTHATRPVKSFFYGRISPGNIPNDYIWLIELLFKFYVNECDHQTVPLVVNQQGWVKGLGLSLLMDCIRIVNPCTIIQINSPVHESRNLAVDLTEDYIESQLGWSVHQDFKSLKERKHERYFVKFNGEPVVMSNKNKALTARNLSITSYFASLFPFAIGHQKDDIDIWTPPLLSTLQPYVVNWSDLAIHVVHEKVADDKMMLAFKMSFVCLCSVSSEFIRISQSDPDGVGNSVKYLTETPISDGVQCLGYGIVRNIDVKNKQFYILTPEPAETLEKVNTLLKGNVQLPESYLLQDPRSTHPYFTYEFISTSFKGAGKPKPRFNLKRKPSRNMLSFGEKPSAKMEKCTHPC